MVLRQGGATVENNYVDIKHLIMRIYDRISDLQDIMMQYNEYNITINEVHILEKLNRNDGTSVKNLARLCNVTNATMTVQIKKLESNGYVTKEKDPQDSRGVLIHMTTKGKKIVKVHEYFYVKLLKGILQSHDQEEIALMYSMLSEIEANLGEAIENRREDLRKKR